MANLNKKTEDSNLDNLIIELLKTQIKVIESHRVVIDACDKVLAKLLKKEDSLQMNNSLPKKEFGNFNSFSLN